MQCRRATVRRSAPNTRLNRMVLAYLFACNTVYGIAGIAIDSRVGSSTRLATANAASLVHRQLTVDGSFDRIEKGLRMIDSTTDHLTESEREAVRANYLSREVDLAAKHISSKRGGLDDFISPTTFIDKARRIPALRNSRAAEPSSYHHQSRKLLMSDAAAADDEENVGMAMSEPTPECRRILNTWTSKCVFTDTMPK